MTLQEAIDSFLFHCRYERNLSPKTLSAYRLDLRQFAAARSATPVDSVGKLELRSYIQNLLNKYQERTVKRKVATLKALFRHLEREELIDATPFRTMRVRIKEPLRLPRTISLHDFRLLFDHVRLQSTAAGDDRSPEAARRVRDLAILEIMFATGARVSEVCSLALGDLDAAEGWVRVLGKGGRERVVQLCHPETLAALGDHIRRRMGRTAKDYLFVSARGTRISEQSVRLMLRRYAAAAGITTRIHPHLVRHSVATLLLRQGVDLRHIQFLLGHRSITTTQIYTHVDAESQREIFTAKHPRWLLGGREMAVGTDGDALRNVRKSD